MTSRSRAQARSRSRCVFAVSYRSCGMLPSRITSSTTPGYSSASSVNGPCNADHSDNHWLIDSAVQNDQRMQMNQNVA